MNPGMYGMSDGRGMAGRKLAGQLTQGLRNSVANPSGNLASYLGHSLPLISLTANTRTRVLSVSGRGALRAFATTNGTGSNESQRVEVWVDGSLLIDTGAVSCGLSAGLMVVGTSMSTSFFMDYIQFDTSLDVFMTVSVGGSSTESIAYRVDVHQ